MNLTASDICEIIKTCKESSVSSLKLDTLEVVFSTPNSKNSPALSNSVHAEQEEKPLVNQVIFQDSTEPKAEETWDRIEELQISNPAQYEEMIAQGGLPDGRIEEA